MHRGACASAAQCRALPATAANRVVLPGKQPAAWAHSYQEHRHESDVLCVCWTCSSPTQAPSRQLCRRCFSGRPRLVISQYHHPSSRGSQCPSLCLHRLPPNGRSHHPSLHTCSTCTPRARCETFTESLPYALYCTRLGSSVEARLPKALILRLSGARMKQPIRCTFMLLSCHA